MVADPILLPKRETLVNRIVHQHKLCESTAGVNGLIAALERTGAPAGAVDEILDATIFAYTQSKMSLSQASAREVARELQNVKAMRAKMEKRIGRQISPARTRLLIALAEYIEELDILESKPKKEGSPADGWKRFWVYSIKRALQRQGIDFYDEGSRDAAWKLVTRILNLLQQQILEHRFPEMKSTDLVKEVRDFP
jgi:hypothetical protein